MTRRHLTGPFQAGAFLWILAGCGPDTDRAPCSPEPTRCVRLDDQATRVGPDGAERFVLTFVNQCRFPVDLKVCFNDARSGADCRERTAIETATRVSEAKETRFLADGIRYFTRYTREARQCRFPQTARVRF